MSVLKITRDIELLEKQLSEIEAKIADPIERLEYKKQLEKKIKKLEHSKRQQEEYEKEQQELEDLKSELTLDKHNLIDKKEPEIYINDTPIITKFETIITEQVNSQNSLEINSETNTLPIAQSNNSKGFIKAWIIGGTIGFFVFFGIVINGNQVTQTTSNYEQQTFDEQPINIEPATITYPPTDIQEDTANNTFVPKPLEPLFTEQDAVNLLKKWQSAKGEIFAPPFNRELGSELLTGKAHYDNVGNPQGSVAWLQNNDSYYIYSVQSIDSVENFAVNDNYATIEVVVTEQRTLYNQYGNIDQNASDLDTRLVRYNLESENGQWKIADYQTLNKIR